MKLPTSTPTKDPDAWRANYKPAQLKAYDAALAAGEKTRDLGGKLGTAAFADAVIARL